MNYWKWLCHLVKKKAQPWQIFVQQFKADCTLSSCTTTSAAQIPWTFMGWFIKKKPIIILSLKGVPQQTRCGPEGFRRFRLPDFMTFSTWRWWGIFERKGCLYFDSMTVVAIHCSSHLTPSEHSTHFATSTDNLSTLPGGRGADFSELHYMPFNSQLFIFKSAAEKLYLLHICWKKYSKSQHAKCTTRASWQIQYNIQCLGLESEGLFIS